MATVQDVLTLVEDYAAANTGQSDNTRKIRHIGLAVEYFKRKGLLPNDELINSFYFNADQFFYSVPSTFMEEIALLYNNPAYNTVDREWEYVDYQSLLKRSGNTPTTNKWSMTTINGLVQLVLIGSNIKSGSVIDAMEEVGDWVVQGDASSLALDNLDFKVGQGSLSFAVSAVSSGLAGINNAGFSLDLETIFENHGYVKAWVKMPSTAIDAIRLRLYETGSKYWTITATVGDAGEAFLANTWQKIGWFIDNAVKTSTPDYTNPIIKVEIEFDLGASFTAPGTFRVDQVFTTIPDYLDLVYRSTIKGTNASGTSITSYSAVTDVVGVGNQFPDILDLIARRAAFSLWPQLRADKDFYIAYQQDLKELIRDVGLRFPRRRVNKLPPTRILR